MGGIFLLGGFSTQVAISLDVLRLLSLHVFYLYIMTARIFSMSLNGLYSLFQLFRGKKWNVLRQRVDSASYGIEQLLIGTILFSVIIFLFPTVTTFYVCFTYIWAYVCIHQCILIVLLIILNYLPLTRLIVKTPTDNISLQAIEPSEDITAEIFSPEVVYFNIRPQPMGISMKLWPVTSALCRTFAPLKSPTAFLRRLFTGQLIYTSPEYIYASKA